MKISKLTWGVKASFRNYVEGMGGSITLDEGVTRSDDGSFVFTAHPDSDLSIAVDGSATGCARFIGGITFDAHGGMLNACLRELAVEASDEGLVLTVLEAPMNDQRCAIATLSLLDTGADGSLTLASAITMDGMYQIADNSPPGTELDPLVLQ